MKSLPVNAFSWPPTSEMNSENSPLGWLLVPLNIRCSRKWAMPTCPRDRRPPVAVPDHVGDDRRAAVGNDDDLEPVISVKCATCAEAAEGEPTSLSVSLENPAAMRRGAAQS